MAGTLAAATAPASGFLAGGAPRSVRRHDGGVGGRGPARPDDRARGDRRRATRRRVPGVPRPPADLGRRRRRAPTGWPTTSPAAGLGCHTERDALAGHESGQDHLGHLPPQRRRVPRVDARRVEGPRRAVQRQLPLRRRGAALPARRRRGHGDRRALALRADAGRGAARPARAARDHPGRRRRPATSCCPGAVWYDDALAAASPRAARRRRRAPTTSTSSTPAARPGCPRACCGATATPWSSASAARRRHATVDEFVAEAADGMRALITPPFMHGAGHWVACACGSAAARSYLLVHPEHLDPADVWGIVERERIEFMLIVGDAFARPLARRARPPRLRPVEPQRRPVRRRRRCRSA